MIFFSIIGVILSLLILYYIIEIAVRNAINSSVIGEFLEEKQGTSAKLDDDDLLDEEFKKQ